MRRLTSSLFVVLAVLTAVPTISAQSREWEDEQLYWMRQERRAIERARYEREQWIAETRYRERVVQKEVERLDRARRDAAEYFGGGYPAYGGGAYGGAWSSWPRQNFPGYGSLYGYPYDYSYGGMSYRGAYGRIVNGGMYFDALIVPCRILSGRQRTEKFVAKVLAGVVGGAALDRDNRKRGALLGGGAGTAWALADDSNYCSPPQRVLLPVNPTTGMNQGGGAEMLPPPSSQASPDPLARVTWPTVNTTDFRAVVTDPNNGMVKLVPAGGSMNLPAPAGDQPYTVELLAPGRGSVDRIPGEIRPSQDLQGWEIVAR